MRERSMPIRESVTYTRGITNDTRENEPYSRGINSYTRELIHKKTGEGKRFVSFHLFSNKERNPTHHSLMTSLTCDMRRLTR